MAEIQVKIHRPVAVPQRFLGAPLIPAASSIVFWCMVMMFSFTNQNTAMIGVFSIFPLVFCHFAIMWWGFKEPHVSSLMQVWNKTTIRPRSIGGTRSDIFRAE